MPKNGLKELPEQLKNEKRKQKDRAQRISFKNLILVTSCFSMLETQVKFLSIRECYEPEAVKIKPESEISCHIALMSIIIGLFYTIYRYLWLSRWVQKLKVL